MATANEICRKLYRDDAGNPFELTAGQAEIFDTIWQRNHPRVRIICPTRYGKSRTIAMALVTRCATFGEKWAVVAPNSRKAKIIMSYALEHALQNEYTRTKLELDKNEDLDRLRRERSKSRLTFKMADGKSVGDLFILSAEGHRTSGKGEGLMGFGAANIVLDESALINDTTYATVKRMLGDAINGDSCLVEVSNPFYRNHFYRVGKEYKKIFIDHEQAIQEGRFTKEFVDEMRKQPLFSILYECKFPNEDGQDQDGWSPLFTTEDIERSQLDVQPFGIPRLGVDVAHGGPDWNAWVLRYDNIAYILRKDHDKSLMGVVGRTLAFAEEYNVDPRYVTIDANGVGAGVVDRLWEQKFNCQAFKGGEKASREDKFINRRAEAFWRLREWIQKGCYLTPDDDWMELTDMKWRVQSDKKIQMMSKDIMAKNGVMSPNCADALSMTFSTVDSERPSIKMSMEAEELVSYRQSQKTNALMDI